MEKAHISALLIEKKPFSLQRLMHDYHEITNQKVPIPGVSAIPLDNDFYEWHGNVKAIANNIYKGAVLHFRISFPKDYPLSPPKVYLLNTGLHHPNVMPDRRICLDMFEKEKGSYKGWKSGYTVLSILLQLQVFFFDVDNNYINPQNNIVMLEIIKNEISAMADFKCSQCRHKGSSNPYPNFPEITEKNIKLTKKQYKEEKKNEICCYHRKTTFLEGALGLVFRFQKSQELAKLKELHQDLILLLLKLIQKKD